MCGGGNNVANTNTTARVNLGLNIIKIVHYTDDVFRSTYVDSLRRRPECCWGKSPYNRALTKADLDLSKIPIGYRSDVMHLIEARRDYIQRVTREADGQETAEQEAAEGHRSGCTMF